MDLLLFFSLIKLGKENHQQRGKDIRVQDTLEMHQARSFLSRPGYKRD